MSNDIKPWLFKKGHNGGPGRTPKKKVDYRGIIEAALTPTVVYDILEKAIEQARDGDKAARQWLLSYVVVPLPKTLRVEDNTSQSREVIDSAIEALPPDEFAALEKILSKVEGGSNNG